MTLTHTLRCAAACGYLLPPDAVIGGRSAAHLWGATLLGADDLVEVMSPQRFGPVTGLRIHTGPLGTQEVVSRGKLRLTDPLRTCWDLARWLGPSEAVVYLDVLASKGVVSVAAMMEYAQARVGQPGWAKLMKAAQLVDATAESPQETRLRVPLVLAGIPKPVAQYVVTTNGQFIARVDLAWPELRIAMEYDGAWHGSRRQLEHDRRRLNQLLGAGWVVLHVTAQRLRDDFDGILAELRAAMRAQRRTMTLAAR